MKKFLILLPLIVLISATTPDDDWSGLLKEKLKKEVAGLVELYKDLHQSGELSLMEKETASKMASHLRSLDFEVTENVGGHGGPLRPNCWR